MPSGVCHDQRVGIGALQLLRGELAPVVERSTRGVRSVLGVGHGKRVGPAHGTRPKRSRAERNGQGPSPGWPRAFSVLAGPSIRVTSLLVTGRWAGARLSPGWSRRSALEQACPPDFPHGASEPRPAACAVRHVPPEPEVGPALGAPPPARPRCRARAHRRTRARDRPTVVEQPGAAGRAGPRRGTEPDGRRRVREAGPGHLGRPGRRQVEGRPERAVHGRGARRRRQLADGARRSARPTPAPTRDRPTRARSPRAGRLRPIPSRSTARATSVSPSRAAR